VLLLLLLLLLLGVLGEVLTRSRINIRYKDGGIGW